MGISDARVAGEAATLVLAAIGNKRITPGRDGMALVEFSYERDSAEGRAFARAYARIVVKGHRDVPVGGHEISLLAADDEGPPRGARDPDAAAQRAAAEGGCRGRADSGGGSSAGRTRDVSRVSARIPGQSQAARVVVTLDPDAAASSMQSAATLRAAVIGGLAAIVAAVLSALNAHRTRLWTRREQWWTRSR